MMIATQESSPTKSLSLNLSEPRTSVRAEARTAGGGIDSRMPGNSLPAQVTDPAPQAAVHDVPPGVTLDRIEQVVAACFSLTPAALHTPSKTRTVALARALIAYLARKYTALSFPAIARRLDRTHATVIHAVHGVEATLHRNGYVRWGEVGHEQEQRLQPILEALEFQLIPTRHVEGAEPAGDRRENTHPAEAP